MRQNRLQQPIDLRWVVFVVAGHRNENLVTGVQRVLEGRFHRGAYPEIVLVSEDSNTECSADIIERAISGSVIHNDQVVIALCGKPTERCSDLLSLVEREWHHKHLWARGCR